MISGRRKKGLAVGPGRILLAHFYWLAVILWMQPNHQLPQGVGFAKLDFNIIYRCLKKIIKKRERLHDRIVSCFDLLISKINYFTENKRS